MHQLYLVLARLTLFLFLVTITTAIKAESLESLLMPGEVIKGHEKYEHECDQCHDTSDKDKQGQLCIKCHAHENILDDLSKKTGFHGRLPKSSQTWQGYRELALWPLVFFLQTVLPHVDYGKIRVSSNIPTLNTHP